MAKFEREIIQSKDLIDEKKILIGLITNKNLLLSIRSKIKNDFFDADYMKRVATWAIDFYDKTKEPISANIKDIYEKETLDLKDTDKELIDELLSSLSETFEGQGNERYLEETFKNLYKKKELKRNIDEALFYYRSDDVDSAYKALRKNNEVEKDTTRCFDPFAKDEILKFFANDEDDRMVIFSSPTLNKFFRYFKPGWFISIQAAEKSGKCVPGSQRVLLSNGDYLPISEIIKTKRNDCISFDEEAGSFTPSKITKYWYNGIKPVYEVTTKTGRSVTVTKNHPFLSPNGWEKLENLSDGDFIAVPRNVSVFGDLDKEEYIVRLIAYFIADGNLTIPQPGFTKKEKEIQEDFTRCVELMGCGVRWKDGQANVTNSIENRWKEDRNYVRDLLIENNLMWKLSYDKSIPPFVYNLTKEKMSLFLGILFTCDGWVCNKEVGYCSTNKVLAEQIQHLLTRFGIVSSLRYKSNDFAGAWIVGISDYHNMELFINEIGFHFSKKKKSFDVLSKKKVSHKSFFDKIPYQKAKLFMDDLRNECISNNIGLYKYFGKSQTHSVNGQINKKLALMKQSFVNAKDSKSYAKHIDTSVLWDEIVSIKYKGEEQTYDLTIDKNHNFIAENILVHNSFFLEELSFCAVEAGYNVLILSVELNEDLMKERLYCRLSGRSKDEEEDVLTPVMDCKHNQHNQCTSKYRSCKTGCYDASGKKMSIDDVYNYSPCTYCRENKSKDYKFEPGIWHEKTNIQKMEPNDVIKQGAIYKKIYKGRMKVCCPDSFSTDIDEIENIIDYLEEVENFYPDFLILDYLDIVNSKSKEVGREKINQIWIRTKQLTDRKKLCTITVEQTSKAGALQVSQDATHVSEEKRKNGHVNAKYSINMTKEESEDSVVRLGEIFHRHFRKQKKQLLCLRQLETASPIIDCELVEVQDTEVKRHTYK